MSVSRLAREHGVNANMLFKWRRHYRASVLGAASTAQPALLPVTITDAPAPISTEGAPAGRIEIAMVDVVVRIKEGVVRLDELAANCPGMMHGGMMSGGMMHGGGMMRN